MCASFPLIHSPAECRLIDIIRTALELRYGFPVEFKTTRILDQTHPSDDRSKTRTLRFSLTYDFKTDREVTLARLPHRVSGTIELCFDRRMKRWLVGSDDQNTFSFYDNNHLIACMRSIEPDRSKRAPDRYAVPAFHSHGSHGCGSGLHDRKLDNLSLD
jgi:hypothetical protein